MADYKPPQPQRVGASAKAETRLAKLRIERGIGQRDLAEAAGISYASYWRLERGQVNNPPLRHLINLAILLKVDLDELIEDSWREWFHFRRGPSEPLDLDDPDWWRRVREITDERHEARVRDSRPS